VRGRIGKGEGKMREGKCEFLLLFIRICPSLRQLHVFHSFKTATTLKVHVLG